MDSEQKAKQEIAHAIFDISLSLETLQRTPLLISEQQRASLRQYIGTLSRIIYDTPIMDEHMKTWENKCAKWRAGLAPDPGPPPQSVGFVDFGGTN
jgi:hypothetical protein